MKRILKEIASMRRELWKISPKGNLAVYYWLVRNGRKNRVWYIPLIADALFSLYAFLTEENK
jgi:hypothetical protein